MAADASSVTVVTGVTVDNIDIAGNGRFRRKRKLGRPLVLFVARILNGFLSVCRITGKVRRVRGSDLDGYTQEAVDDDDDEVAAEEGFRNDAAGSRATQATSGGQRARTQKDDQPQRRLRATPGNPSEPGFEAHLEDGGFADGPGLHHGAFVHLGEVASQQPPLVNRTTNSF